MREGAYQKFQASLLPTLPPQSILGVRMPLLRAYAKILAKSPELPAFLQDLPHRYYEENQLHAVLLSGCPDYGICIQDVQRFLPYVDNWSTCDALRPRVFRKNPGALLDEIWLWLNSAHPYTVRFAIAMLMEHFLDDGAFDMRYPAAVAALRSTEYYVNLMVAWYFATALAKQYDSVLPFLENSALDPWTRRKTIQKAIESRRLTTEQKAYLRSLR